MERYLQLVGQDPVLSKSNLLRTFLLNAQQESAFTDAYETTIDVFLMNGFCIKVQVIFVGNWLKFKFNVSILRFQQPNAAQRYSRKL